jgi:hypothetical protein
LKTTLYDVSGEELSVDTMAVNIFHGDTAQAADRGESPIDMTYPVSGGPLGQYTAPNGKSNSVFDSVRKGSASVKALVHHLRTRHVSRMEVVQPG